MSRWRDNDLKGNRKQQYSKEVTNKNVKILTIVQQSPLEKLANYTDGHKCLNNRKALMNCMGQVTHFCQTITQNKFFEYFIILVIVLNCFTLAQSDNTVEETALQKNIELAF